MRNMHFLWLIAIWFLTSCSQDEKFYSCNQDIDQWTKERLDDIKTMKRSDWLQVDGEEYRRAAYRAFDPIQKYIFWKDKIAEVLELDWNPEEKKHIKLLADYLNQHSDMFDKANFDEDSFEIFMYSWSEKAKEEFQWDGQILYAIVASGEKMIDIKGTLEIKDSKPLTRATKNDCGCSKSSDYCSFRNSPPGSYPIVVFSCGSDNCDTVGGCGTLLQYTCDGNCFGKYV